MSVLKKDFYLQPVLKVAPALLGKFLVLRNGGTEIARMITEVEAYDGPNDKACHAFKGLTPRTKVMFEEGGVWYVYLIYGMYYMLNIVTGPRDYPAAVLIRGVDGSNGPGKLTTLYGVNSRFNGLESKKKLGLYIEDRGVVVKSSQIKKSPRIGVDYAGTIWSKKEYRFSTHMPTRESFQ